jgi:hypothetical protein
VPWIVSYLVCAHFCVTLSCCFPEAVFRGNVTGSTDCTVFTIDATHTLTLHFVWADNAGRSLACPSTR